jgi:hypothetical protein
MLLAEGRSKHSALARRFFSSRIHPQCLPSGKRTRKCEEMYPQIYPFFWQHSLHFRYQRKLFIVEVADDPGRQLQG